MDIGIIGSGPVGQSLAKGFKAEGHYVTLGTRNPAKPELDDFKKENPNINIATFEDAAKAGEMLVLATAGGVAEEALKLAGIENLKGKVVIDTTNPIAKQPPTNGVLSFFTNYDESLMERLQRFAREAK